MSKSFEEWRAADARRLPHYKARGPRLWRKAAYEWQRATAWQVLADVEQAMNAVNGPFIEIAGPSPTREAGVRGGHLYDMAKLDRPFRISNRSLEAKDVAWDDHLTLGRWPFKHKVPSPPESVLSRIEFLTDATRLALASGSVAALSSTALPRRGEEFFSSVYKEAHRVLKSGGFLFSQAIGESQLDTLLDNGFEPVKARRTWSVNPDRPGRAEPQYDVMARKPAGREAAPPQR